MAKNINFISATELPEATGEEVSVLCLENGEMKQKPANGLGGGFMEVEITLSGSDFYSGTATFNKTYDEIKEAMGKGYFVMGWAKNQQFTGEQQYHYSFSYLHPMFPKYAADINGGTIFFISTESSTAAMYIQADGTTGVYLD